MDSKLAADKEFMESEFARLIKKCRDHINKLHDYVKAYDFAVQAKYVAETFLDQEMYSIESDLLRGLSYLGIDNLEGHEIIERVYQEKRQLIEEDIHLNIRFKKSMGVAKRYLDEYDEAIGYFSETIQLAQQVIAKEDQKNEHSKNTLYRIIYCLIQTGICLLLKSRQVTYPLLVRQIEQKFREVNLDVTEIAREIEQMILPVEGIYELEEAKKYISQGLELARENDFQGLEAACLFNYGCILMEEEDYVGALEIFTSIQKEPYIVENLWGHILNEMAIALLHTGHEEEVADLLQEAWVWLSERKNFSELNRNIFATALQYYKQGNLDMARAFAEIAYTKEQDITCLKLLYEIALLKYLQARKTGNEFAYVLYRSEYEKYKEQMERRA